MTLTVLLAVTTAHAAIVPDGPASAPTFAVNVYGVYSGLPHHSAQILAQTKDGYLWIGTESGLARFDGVRFVTFRTADTPALPANLIRCLWEAPDGWLWIATQGGVCRYREGRFERIGLDGERVVNVAGDASGRVWIATQTKGLIEYRDGRLISHATDPGMPAEKDVRSLFVDSTQRLWVVFRTAGIVYFENGQPRPLDPAPFQANDFVRMVESPGKTLWIASERHGVWRLRGNEIRHYDQTDGLGAEAIHAIYCDRAARIWVITDKPYLLPDAEAERFLPIALSALENCREIIEDHEGSYWVGSAGDGVAKIRPSGFRMLSPEGGTFDGNTRTLMIDPDDVAWIGLAESGAVRLAPDGTKTVIPSSGAEVWSIWHASDGDVWIGTRGALHRWRNGKTEIFPAYQRVRALFEDHRHTLWIGSETEGVSCYRDGRFTSLVSAIEARQKDVTPPSAMVFAEGPDGTVYIGLRERGGLVSIKDGVITTDQSLPSNDLRAIYPDPNGDLWVGTKGRGLVLRHDGRWLNPEEFSLPFNDQVGAIVPDNRGRMWLGAPKGIVWTSKAHLLALARGEHTRETFRLATTGDGVRPGTIGTGSGPITAESPDGRLWFASRRGVVVIDPAAVTRNTVIPPVHVERILADNHDLNAAADRTVRLPPGTRSLAIEYTALSFVGPSQVLFRYRLDGRDRDWTDAGTRRTALYADLAPGTYTFHVIACNDDGVWNETGAKITVIQLPYFYQTKWFFGATALGLLTLGLTVFQWRTASLRQRNDELQTRITERTAELAKSYEKVRASEYFYHSLVESLPQIIVRKDVSGRFTYANAGFSELVGRPLDEIIGRTDEDLFPAAEAQKHRADDQRVLQAGEALEYENIVEQAAGKRYLHVKHVPLRDEQGRSLGVQILFWDMTSVREIEEKLKQAQRELVETSRLAGIAEMATGILHNLGNALNSVNTTASLAASRIRASKVASVQRVAELLAQQNDHLADFMARDQRGQQLPKFLATLGEHLTHEQQEILHELGALQDNVNHIRELVASQQQYARVAGVVEVLPPSELAEFALRLGEAGLKRHDIQIVRELMSAPPVRVDRQKALQIMSNLLGNAKDALKDRPATERRIIVGVRVSPEGRPQIYVTDNGVGIAPEHLTRIFAFGFTTKPNGHGFGLHSSALAATELGGALTASSEGPGRGATFVLELPAAKS